MVTGFSQVPGQPLKVNREDGYPQIKDREPLIPETPLCERAASLPLSPFCIFLLSPSLDLLDDYHNTLMAQMEELGLTGILSGSKG